MLHNIREVLSCRGNQAGMKDDGKRIKRELLSILSGQETMAEILPDSQLKPVPINQIENFFDLSFHGNIHYGTTSRLENIIKQERTKVVSRNEEIMLELDSVLEERSKIAERVRETINVRGEDRRLRIMTSNNTWHRIYTVCQQKLELKDTKVSISSLDIIRKDLFPEYRQPRASDTQYSQCNTCGPLTLILSQARKNKHFNLPEKDLDILKLSVCDIDNQDCLWNRCDNCKVSSQEGPQPGIERTYEALKAFVNDFEVNKDEDFIYSELVGKIWEQQCLTIDEGLREIAMKSHCGSRVATGSKVVHHLLKDKDMAKYIKEQHRMNTTSTDTICLHFDFGKTQDVIKSYQKLK